MGSEWKLKNPYYPCTTIPARKIRVDAVHLRFTASPSFTSNNVRELGRKLAQVDKAELTFSNPGLYRRGHLELFVSGRWESRLESDHPFAEDDLTFMI